MIKLEKPKKQQKNLTTLSFQMPEELAQEFKEKCKKYDVSGSYALRELVKYWLESKENTENN